MLIVEFHDLFKLVKITEMLIFLDSSLRIYGKVKIYTSNTDGNVIPVINTDVPYLFFISLPLKIKVNVGVQMLEIWDLMTMSARIAATAIQHNLILVSADSDFFRIQQAQPFLVESWL
jgi:hypothetical protein